MVLTALCFNNALAAEDIAGIWEGKLVPAPGTELTVQFKIKKSDDGSYTALINSPDTGGLKNVPATSVTYDAGTLKIVATEVNGTFEGLVEDNLIAGKWSQEGTSFPLSLRPYEEPKLSPEAMNILMGRWQGKLDTPVAELVIVFRFEESNTGDLTGFMDVPAQAARGIPISEIAMDSGSLTLKIAAAAAEYRATTSGDGFDGKWIQGGQEIPLNVKKGGKAPVDRLNLSKTSFDMLSGHWNGALTPKQGPVKTVTIVLRFENTKQGEIVGFMDAPDQGTSGVPITSASLEDGGFDFKIAVARVEYAGRLSGNELVGEWKQAGIGLPLTLKKGKAPVKKLTLSPAAMGRLSGRWQGRVDTPQATLRVVFRFERTEQGDPVGYLDSPDQGRSGIPIDEAKLEEGSLTMKVDGLMAEYKGTLSGDKIAGQLSLAGNSFDVPLERSRSGKR